MTNINKHNSKIVTSNQQGIHVRLDEIVNRHIQSDYLKPNQPHNLKAFNKMRDATNNGHYESLILDSCCGTGMSSRKLAEQNPTKLVVGIDQSYKRLNKQLKDVVTPANCLLLRANCEDIWRLCIANDLHFEAHYILYPNPWPKSVHFIRRWHGHPVFPFLKNLAAKTLLRSNWKTYLQEFSRAWYLLTGEFSTVKAIDIEKPLTLFEKKYALSEQTIYQLQLN
jgi:tRNA (guanine-N7-)-methyltransferase